MHDDVAKLAREERLLEAAELASAYGDHHTASELFERACAWDRAAKAALAAGERGRALILAALGNVDDTAEMALDTLKTEASNGELRASASGLQQRGQYAWAAKTYEAALAYQEAGEAWERAGNPLQAARVFDTAKDGQGALRAAGVLDAALRLEPDRNDLRVALGGLLLRYGKAAAALRIVQRVPDESIEGREALRLSTMALTELGMSDARAEAHARLAVLVDPVRTPHPPRILPTQDEREVMGGGPKGGHGPTLYGRYEILREVSSTATARLVECQDTLRGERVALKIFSADGPRVRGGGRDALARFMREARVLAELTHPNIVPLRAIIEQGPALVLAWMPGGTLEERIATEVFTPAQAVDVATAVLHALGEAHRLGIVHRDIKPANILFDVGGTARLADFGVAHLGDLSVTATAGIFGSLAYMSPEQREGRPVTAQSDLYGVGIVLLEMLTGKRPVAHDSSHRSVAPFEPLAMFHKHLDARHDAAVARLFSDDSGARPRDAFTAANALELLPWPTELDPSRTREPAPKPASQHRLPQRLEVRSSGADANAHDLWIDRPVLRVPLTERLLARAALFARVAHRALQPVLRVDRAAGTLWLGIPHGEPLARPLLSHEFQVLDRALSLLHGSNFIHGAIDRAAVVVGTNGPVLLFPLAGEPPSAYANPDMDYTALRRL